MFKAFFSAMLISTLSFSAYSSTYTCKLADSSDNWVLNIDTTKRTAEVYDTVVWSTLELTHWGLVKKGNEMGILFLFTGSYSADKSVSLEVDFSELDSTATLTTKLNDLEDTVNFTCTEIK